MQKTTQICSKFQGLTQIFDYNFKTVIWIFTISIMFTFSKSRNLCADISTEQPCLRDLENPSQLPVREVLMILSYKFLEFSHYSSFRSQGIHF